MSRMLLTNNQQAMTYLRFLIFTFIILAKPYGVLATGNVYHWTDYRTEYSENIPVCNGQSTYIAVNLPDDFVEGNDALVMQVAVESVGQWYSWGIQGRETLSKNFRHYKPFIRFNDSFFGSYAVPVDHNPKYQSREVNVKKKHLKPGENILEFSLILPNQWGYGECRSGGCCGFLIKKLSFIDAPQIDALQVNDPQPKSKLSVSSKPSGANIYIDSTTDGSPINPVNDSKVVPLKINHFSAPDRVALVIGNNDYSTAPLKNPVNDAQDIAAVLKRLHFDVIIETDADKRRMITAIETFAEKLKRAEIGLFYYAGHGMQINNSNYLLPVKVQVSSESDVEFEAVNVGRILGKMKSAGSSLNVVILDACRNNPFTRSFRSSEQGLARMDAPIGTIIAYATGPGAVAADGTGRNGIFTKHLLNSLQHPKMDIQDIFNEAGMGVMKETGNKQIPWTSNTPIPRFYFAGDR